MEIWTEIPGYDGWYDCSNQGRVRSWRIPNKPGARAGVPRIMSQSSANGGYLFVSLAFEGRQVLPRVNRLVLQSYIGPPFTGAHACHRNGDNQDNRLENLYWGSPKENARDKRLHGTHLTGERVGTAKLTAKQVEDIRRKYATGEISHRQLARNYRVSKSTIGRAVRLEHWKEVE